MSASPATSWSRRGSPALSIGLPVYNGEQYLEQSLNALLAQTFDDFELIISDNASTDRTADICRDYAARDGRIRYVRQPVNIGAARNHNCLVPLARGQYFKWASHDDLYARELVERCIDALETRPEVVLAHSWDAVVDEIGDVVMKAPYALDTANPDPSARLRSLLHTPGGNDFYGVIRTAVLRSVPPHGTYYNADRTFMAALVLSGPFYQVPEVLYFRRDHDQRASRGSRRSRAAALGPERRARLRHPMARMYAEYLSGFFRAVRVTDLSRRDRIRCRLAILGWMSGRLLPGRSPQSVEATLDAR